MYEQEEKNTFFKLKNIYIYKIAMKIVWKILLRQQAEANQTA